MITRDKVIGQVELLDRIDYLINSNKFPRFSIMVGPKNSGKKLISDYIANKLNATFIPCDNKVDSVRDIVTMSYEQANTMCYMWADADTMSIAAKNALLKITEEPPQNSYFIITLTDVNNMIQTILSRGTTFYINPYSNDNILDYCTKIRNYDIKDYTQIVSSICTTPGDADTLCKYNISDFITFTNKVLDNIGKASSANCLKLSNNFKLKKDETDKYDIVTFLHCVEVICNERLIDTGLKVYGDACIITCKVLAELRNISISKLAVIDSWLLQLNTLFKEV